MSAGGGVAAGGRAVPAFVVGRVWGGGCGQQLGGSWWVEREVGEVGNVGRWRIVEG